MESEAPILFKSLATEFIKENTKDHIYVRTPTPPKVKTSTTAADVSHT